MREKKENKRKRKTPGTLTGRFYGDSRVVELKKQEWSKEIPRANSRSNSYTEVWGNKGKILGFSFTSVEEENLWSWRQASERCLLPGYLRGADEAGAADRSLVNTVRNSTKSRKKSSPSSSHLLIWLWNWQNLTPAGKGVWEL